LDHLREVARLVDHFGGNRNRDHVATSSHGDSLIARCSRSAPSEFTGGKTTKDLDKPHLRLLLTTSLRHVSNRPPTDHK
jgi:hypothetical protein